MTQAFNLSLFANNLNTSGATSNTGLQNSAVTVTAGTGMSGGGSVALGSSVTLTNAGVTSIVAGTGISVSGATGAVTVSTASAILPGILSQIFTSSGTFTIPSGVTALKITVVGGGGAGAGCQYGGSGGGGGGGGLGVQYLTGLTPTNTLAITVGGVAGTSSVASGTQTITTISASGGATAAYASNNVSGAGGAGGSSFANTAYVYYGGNGGDGASFYSPNPIQYSGGGGVVGQSALPGNTSGISTNTGMFGKGAAGIQSSPSNGVAGIGYGAGGSGGLDNDTGVRTGGAGTGGIVIIEW